VEIIRSKKYLYSLQKIITYISKDSKKRAFDFKHNIDKAVNDLIYMPYKCRQSIYFEDEHKRDLIIKGYTIVYKIDELKDMITIIGIKKYQNNL